MALVPPSGTHANPDSYAFANTIGANAQQLVVVPSQSQTQANFTITNGSNPATYVKHYMTNAPGGGLIPNHYQAFLYGASVGGNEIAEIFDVYGLGNNYSAINMNRGLPLDGTRMGSFTGTGAVVNVAVPSISANSQVRVAFVGGSLPAAAPVIVVTANTGFSHNASVGSIYQYEVVG